MATINVYLRLSQHVLRERNRQYFGKAAPPPPSDRASLTLHRQRGGYDIFVLLLTNTWTADMSRPAIELARDLPVQALGEEFMELLRPTALRADRSAAPTTSPAKYPVLRQARVCSYKEFLQTGQTVSVAREESRYHVDPWVRDVTRRDNVQVPAPDGFAWLTHPNAEQLGTAVVRSCDLVADFCGQALIGYRTSAR